MKTALIADIHGNYEALMRVMDDARAQGAGMFVFLGDYIFDLPGSPQVVETLMKLPDAHFIAGNKEGYLREDFWNDPRKQGLEQLAVLFETRRLLTEEQKQFLMALPPCKAVRLPSGRKLYCVHSGRAIARTPRCEFNSSGAFAERYGAGGSDRAAYLKGLEAFLSRDMGRELAAIPADVVAWGHDHLSGWARVKGKLVVKPGSCGLPLDGDARAAYALIDDSDAEIHVTERRVSYDVGAVIRQARASSCYARGWRWSEMIYAELARAREIVAGFFADARAIAQENGEAPDDFGNDIFRAAFERTRRREGF